MIGIGPVAVRQPRVRDRDAAVDDPGRIRFTPDPAPTCDARSRSRTLLPILYLKGVSTGDFSERSRPCWARTQWGCRQPPLAASRMAASASKTHGRSARSVGKTLRLRLGGWHLRASPARRRELPWSSPCRAQGTTPRSPYFALWSISFRRRSPTCARIETTGGNARKGSSS